MCNYFTDLAALNGDDSICLPARVMIEGNLDCVGRSRYPLLFCLRINLKHVGLSGEHGSLSVMWYH